jgi:hypothetical protein
MKTKSFMNGVAIVALGLALAAGAAYADPCVAPDNGTGTVTLPPPGCEYLSPDQVHAIIDGLPPDTTIILKPIHQDFICRKQGGGGVPGQCGTPGGPLGGEVEDFQSIGTFQMSGTGALAGWTRTLSVPLVVQTATGPRQNGAAVQSFPTDMLRIQGSISGDPDFAFFEVVGGTANGFKSPGHTTLTLQADGNYTVDSSFSVGYRIRFAGAPGGKLAGFGGTTVGTVNMSAITAGTGCN